jgi:divalent anion:Na+ symporter, DASS family
MADSPFLSSRQRWARLAILAAIYLGVVYLVPKPAAVKQEGWQLTGLFIATVAGLMLQPIGGGALVLISVTLAAIVGGLTISQSLAGYADSTVWLVMAAFFISRALINTGLARRIALMFVRAFGRTSLGVSYALALSDSLLATIIPSNGARSGGVILPIVSSVAQLYGSHPGPTARLIGSFLMLSVYQSVCVTSAMFFTGQASNPLAAKIAGDVAKFEVTWSSWFIAAVVPGVCSLAIVPWVVQKLYPPERLHTPEAAEFARAELEKAGPLAKNERILSAVFFGVCALWVTSGWTKIDVTVSALVGACALLLTDVITWEDVKNERSAWDIFVWYGGLLNLGKALNATGVTTEFAKLVAGWFDGAGWVLLFVVSLLVYYYAHYAFASITAHLLAMYPAFLAVLLAQGAPVGLSVFAFACGVNLAAGLTTYGTTPAPMFFAQEYVSFKDWWRVGFIVSLVHIAIWGTVGVAWWRVLGLW